jgi:hypothetical protein
MRDLASTIDHMVTDGFDYTEAACMVASWHIAELILGPEIDGVTEVAELALGEVDRDGIECQIQEVLRTAFGCGRES